MSTKRLTYSQVKPYRLTMLVEQGRMCALCGQPLAEDKAVLDHDHKEGHVRGVLHAGCNSLLGKLENNYRRYGVDNLHLFLAGASAYLVRGSRIPSEERVLHPTFKTDEQKAEARRAAARKRYQAKKLENNRS